MMCSGHQPKQPRGGVADFYGESTPAYAALATYLRDRIHAGEFSDDAQLPSATDLSRQHGVSVEVARWALRSLVREGLVYSAGRRGTRVRPRPQRTIRDMSAGDGPRERVTARMPTPEEQVTHSVGAGVPVLVVTREYVTGGEVVRTVHIVLPADRTELLYPAREDAPE
jgi:GntR family transcriptional regulator